MIGFKEFFNRNEHKEEFLICGWEEINPYAENFFNNVLNYVSRDNNVLDFQEAIRYIIDNEKLCSFKIPRFYFSIVEKLYDYLWEHTKYKEICEILLPKNDGYCDFSTAMNYLKRIKKCWKNRNLKIGNQFQYYMFLVELVNRLVNEGYDIESAMSKVIGIRESCLYSMAFLCIPNIGENAYCLCGLGRKGTYKYPPLADLKLFNSGISDIDVILFVIL